MHSLLLSTETAMHGLQRRTRHSAMPAFGVSTKHELHSDDLRQHHCSMQRRWKSWSRISSAGAGAPGAAGGAAAAAASASSGSSSRKSLNHRLRGERRVRTGDVGAHASDRKKGGTRLGLQRSVSRQLRATTMQLHAARVARRGGRDASVQDEAFRCAGCICEARARARSARGGGVRALGAREGGARTAPGQASARAKSEAPRKRSAARPDRARRNARRERRCPRRAGPPSPPRCAQRRERGGALRCHVSRIPPAACERATFEGEADVSRANGRIKGPRKCIAKRPAAVSMRA